jgi:hypothetical protein
MPIPLIIANGVLVRLIWTAGGTTQMINVFGGQVTGSFTNSQSIANTVGAAVKAALASSGFGAKLATSTSLSAVGIRDVRTPSNAEYIDVSGPAAGTATGDTLPPSTALAITLRTAKAGQSYRGRTFFGGFTEAWNGPGGAADATVGTTGVAFVTAIQSALNTSGITLSVASRPAPQIQTTTTYTYSDGSTKTTTHLQHSRVGQMTPVTAILARNLIWDSQRRRAAPGKMSSLFLAPVAQMSLASD